MMLLKYYPSLFQQSKRTFFRRRRNTLGNDGETDQGSRFFLRERMLSRCSLFMALPNYTKRVNWIEHKESDERGELRATINCRVRIVDTREIPLRPYLKIKNTQ